jgi:Transposase DDE domain
MRNTTPFFAGFHRLLFGRAQRSAQHQLRAQAQTLEQASLSQLGKVCAPWVPARLLKPNARGAHSRRRSFPQGLTFWAFLSQVLSPGSPCRETVRKVQAWYTARRLPRPGSDTGAYCRARSRLSGDTLRRVHRHTVYELQRRVNSDQLWCGRSVKVIDGTGVSMPDTPQNQKAFPQPANQKKGCGFPVAKLVGCFCLASGALLQWAEGTQHVHERKLFRKLFRFFVPGDIALTDRGFCSYVDIATLLRAGVDTVMRLHQARPHDLRKGKRLGPNDRLVAWQRPRQCPRGCTLTDWRRAPDTLTLRLVYVSVNVPGFRTQSLVVVTTLTDPLAYPAEEIARLYLRRWAVELFFRDIKITLGMDVLRCQTPAMVRKEIVMHAIAYNLIRAIMQQAAALYHVPIERLSFKGSVDTLRQWTDTLNAAHDQPREQARLFNQLLQILAEDIVPFRPERAEPRVRKRRPKAYPLMTKPRQQYHLAWES